MWSCNYLKGWEVEELLLGRSSSCDYLKGWEVEELLLGRSSSPWELVGSYTLIMSGQLRTTTWFYTQSMVSQGHWVMSGLPQRVWQALEDNQRPPMRVSIITAIWHRVASVFPPYLLPWAPFICFLLYDGRWFTYGRTSQRPPDAIVRVPNYIGLLTRRWMDTFTTVSTRLSSYVRQREIFKYHLERMATRCPSIVGETSDLESSGRIISHKQNEQDTCTALCEMEMMCV